MNLCAIVWSTPQEISALYHTTIITTIGVADIYTYVNMHTSNMKRKCCNCLRRYWYIYRNASHSSRNPITQLDKAIFQLKKKKKHFFHIIISCVFSRGSCVYNCVTLPRMLLGTHVVIVTAETDYPLPNCVHIHFLVSVNE